MLICSLLGGAAIYVPCFRVLSLCADGAIQRGFGLGYSRTPVLSYLIRAVSALYAIVGACWCAFHSIRIVIGL
jgi:hypothetical protein